MTKEKIKEVHVIHEGEKIDATLLDHGENFSQGEGGVPNHDKVLIVYTAVDN